MTRAVLLLALAVVLAPAVAPAQGPARPAPRPAPGPPAAREPAHAVEKRAPGDVVIPEGATVSTACRNAVVHVSVCKGGACAEVLSYATAPYGCNKAGTDMNAGCTASADCAAGAGCNVASGQCAFLGYTCSDAWTVQGANGEQVSCAPYQCKAGRCWTVCASPADCAPGYSCFNSAACVKSAPHR